MAKNPEPFVKWVGGKRQLLPILTSNLPSEYGTYFEPFIGGGALFFHLRPARAVISDINPELINCYITIRDNLTPLMGSLASHVNEESYYYEIRAKQPSDLSEVERASRFIYLNRTCFNGLHRENSKGQFNAAYGKYANPVILNRENLTAVSQFLNDNDITIKCCGYQETVSEAVEGDFVYLDPPYVPFTPSANFTKYCKHAFGMAQQEELASTFRQLSESGVYVMESNSNTDIVRYLYQGFEIETVFARRNISRNLSERGKAANEVLIRSYSVSGLKPLF